MLMLKGTARKTEAFPEQVNCNGVMVMPQRAGGKGCLYRHKNSPGLTLTHRRSLLGDMARHLHEPVVVWS